MSDEIKYLDVAEFRRLGYLQEANRLFFHPRGLALEIKVADDGTETLGGVWDAREDDEGWMFGDWGDDADAKATVVREELERHLDARRGIFGAIIFRRDEEMEPSYAQQVGWLPPDAR